jgi:hypothetical protein
MKKLIIAVLGFALLIGTVSAWGLMPGNGNGNPNFINLTEKTAVETGAYPWILDGGYGKLMWKENPKPMFVFTAGNMTPDTEYALISYAEPWGSTNNVLGIAVSNETGNVSIMQKYNLYDTLVCNSYPTPTSDEYSGTGSKVWLVPTADLLIDEEAGTAVFTAWNPSEYLFETDLINKDCELPV